MGRLLENLRSFGREFRAVLGAEYRHLFTDMGAILILILAALIYATLYSEAYSPEVLRNVPVGVIDHSRTAASRRLTELFTAGPNMRVVCEPADMAEAEALFYARRIHGVIYIPADYERELLAGRQAVVSLYLDASYFLMYRQVFQEAVASVNATGAAIEWNRLVARGAQIPQARAITQPVIYQSHNLFNPYLGYGTFVMPAILVIILQQTLLIGVGMTGGTWREQGLYKKLVPAGSERLSATALLAAKTFAYGSIYAVTTTYLFSVHYPLFHYPMNGNPTTAAALLGSYLLACILMATALSTLFRYREQSLMFLLWTSIPILLLSGASLPPESMPEWLFRFGKIFPSSSAIPAFVRVQSMGASFGDILPEMRQLWRLALLYGLLAWLGLRRVTSR